MKELLDLTEAWKSSSQQTHKMLSKLFSRIFRITEDGSRMKISAALQVKAFKEWLQGDDTRMDLMELQYVTFVYNLVTLENITYNPLRANRPSLGATKHDNNWVDSLAEKSAKQCDLCDYKQYTAEDMFGRLESVHAYTAANAFKMDAWHSMVIFRTHHPTTWSLTELIGSFDLMLQWFEKVHSLSSQHKYPVILWDSLPAAGSSQVHPHIHMMLNQNQYSGELGRWHLSAKQYRNKYESDYWSDLVKVSSALGISITLGNATAIVNLTPRMGYEVILLSSQPCDSLWKLLYYTIQMYFTKLGQYSFSMAMVLPPWGDSSDAAQPAFARIVPRGTSDNNRSDVCSLELFASPSISVNPLKTASLLQSTICECST